MMDHCGSITGRSVDAEFDIDTSAGDKCLIEEILFQAAVWYCFIRNFWSCGEYSPPIRTDE